MKFTIAQFNERFPNDDACLDEIFRLRFGALAECPKCQRAFKYHRIKERRSYACQWCANQVYPTKGTPFEKSTTPLKSWMYAIYLMTASRHGVPAKELERQLGVTYKTAWRMAHEIRKLMGSADSTEPLKGHVEVDETYVGGKRRGKRGRGAAGKTAVFGMVERGGNVKAKVVPNVMMSTLTKEVIQNVLAETLISSDEYNAYNSLSANGYIHGIVKHGAKQYVNGEFHTQSIEGFWSRLKVSVSGTHVWVSKKHLQKYVDEFAFRYNMRHNPALMFDLLLGHLKSRD